MLNDNQLLGFNIRLGCILIIHDCCNFCSSTCILKGKMCIWVKCGINDAEMEKSSYQRIISQECISQSVNPIQWQCLGQILEWHHIMHETIIQKPMDNQFLVIRSQTMVYATLNSNESQRAWYHQEQMYGLHWCEWKNGVKNMGHCGDIGMINKCCMLWRDRR